MQTKTSYRVLKWMFLAGVASSLATACVVSSGDGVDDDTDFDDGGDGGTNTTSGGKGNTGGGGSSTAGTNSTDGGMPTMTDGGTPSTGDGGTPSTFVPGECQVDEPLTPSVEPVCDAADGDDDCIKCVKLQACNEYKVCFGEEPATACSVGMTAGADGQFACVTKCFKAGAAEAATADELLSECADQCDECGTGGLNDETTDLIAAANVAEACQAECFPF